MTREESRDRLIWMAAGAAAFAGGLAFGMFVTRGRMSALVHRVVRRLCDGSHTGDEL